MAMQRFARTCLVLSSMFLLVLACNSSTPTESPESAVEFQTILKGLLPGYQPDLQGQAAILDRASWQAVWADLHGGAPPPLPEIDFNREMVILVLAQGCCNDVEIVSVFNRRSELVVTALSPSSPDNKVCAFPDFSVHVVRLPRFDVPVRFAVSRSEKLC